jgi:hypothetical protein
MKIIAEKFATPHATEKNLKNPYFRSNFNKPRRIWPQIYQKTLGTQTLQYILAGNIIM